MMVAAERGGDAKAPEREPRALRGSWRDATSMREEMQLLETEGICGKYEIREFLGQGAMADVYLGVHGEIGRRVAIKILNWQHRQNDELRQRFLQEAKLASSIDHPAVIGISDYGETSEGWPYLVMDYLHGEELEALMLREGALPWPRTRGLLLQLLSGVAAAHRGGVVHRDLKPRNCFLCESGAKTESDRVVILDFGLAKPLPWSGVSGDHVHTDDGTVMGTALYMSPEQCRGHDVDARTDIYSIGIIGYRLLTGRLPFEADAALAVLSQHLHDAPPPMWTDEDGGPRVAPEIEQLIFRALVKEPEGRYRTAEEFIEAIHEVDDIRDKAAARRSRTRLQRQMGLFVVCCMALSSIMTAWLVWQVQRLEPGQDNRFEASVPPALQPTRTLDSHRPTTRPADQRAAGNSATTDSSDSAH